MTALINPRAGWKRKAEIGQCKCGRVVLTGLDADIGASSVKVEIVPLTHRGEASACLAGWRTYSYFCGELHRRTPWLVINRPEDRVFALHRCGQEIPQDWRKEIKPKVSLSDEPNF